MSKSIFRSWEVYQLATELANAIFETSLRFPREERYSLTDQIRRSSRSVLANLAEGSAKTRYPKHFIAKLTDSAAENYETQVWLSFAKECKYITEDQYKQYNGLSESVGKLLNYMLRYPEKFGCLKKRYS